MNFQNSCICIRFCLLSYIYDIVSRCTCVLHNSLAWTRAGVADGPVLEAALTGEDLILSLLYKGTHIHMQTMVLHVQQPLNKSLLEPLHGVQWSSYLCAIIYILIFH